MKIFIKNLSEITIPEQKETAKRPFRPAESRVRFSITIAEENSDPWLTIDGWTVDKNRMIRPPYTRVKFGTALVTYQHPSNKCLAEVRAAVMSIPDVDEILGMPEPGKMRGGTPIPGSAEVK